jgi:hypothetical protein
VELPSNLEDRTHRPRIRTRGPSPARLVTRFLSVSLVVSFLCSSALIAFESDGTSAIRPEAVLPAGPSFPSPIRHVIILMMEDQDVANVLAYGPYERYLADHYAFASDYYGLTSDSLQNYEDVMSGTTTPSNILNQSPVHPITAFIDKLGLTWATYHESMPVPCDEENTTYTVGNESYTNYDIDHNPFVWFSNITGNSAYCGSHVLSLADWSSALAAGDLPNYVWVTPNDTDDDHSTECDAGGGATVCIPHGDRWLQNFLTPFVNSSAFSSSVIFLTFDYNSIEHATSGEKALVYFAAISPYAHLGYRSSIDYTHFNLLTTSEWLLGIPSGKLNHNDNWAVNPPMYDLFRFPSAYSVTFTESGLPAGTNWAVTLGGAMEASSTTSLVFSEIDGTYAYSIGVVGGWYQGTLPYSGWITVNGAAVTMETMRFVPQPYNVTFIESGLPAGVSWWVNLTNGQKFGSLTQSLSFTEPNGTYRYAVATGLVGWGPSPTSGSFNVSGTPVSESIAFSRLTYTLTFLETGLPTGTNWSMTLIGGSSAVISSSAVGEGQVTVTRWSNGAASIEFDVTSGNYSYSGFARGYPLVNGTLPVIGISPPPVTVVFSANQSSGFSTLDYAIVGVVCVVAALGVIFVLLRRHGRSPPGNP